MTDKEIITLYKKSPQKAFGLVVRQHQEALYWYIRKTIVSHDDTHDIIQNAFKNAWMAFAKFEGKSSISTWLHTIATNEMYGHLRKQKKAAYGSDDVDRILQNERASGYFSGDEAQANLVKAIATLPERQREVFTLKYFQEKSYAEIVEILGGSVGSHKASFHHAKEKIKKIITTELNLF